MRTSNQFDIFFDFPDAIILVNDNYNIIYANRRAHDLFDGSWFSGLNQIDVRRLLQTSDGDKHINDGLWHVGRVVSDETGFSGKVNSTNIEFRKFHLGESKISDEMCGFQIRPVVMPEQVVTPKAISHLNKVYPNDILAGLSQLNLLMTVPHELRTPLNSILGWIQLLQKTPSVELFERVLPIIRRNAEVQSKVIDDLLNFGLIVTQKLKLSTTPVDVKGVMEDAIATILPAALAKNIEVDVRNIDAVVISADRLRLHQALCNILSNAVKFTPPQGSITVHVSYASKYIYLFFDDSGPGIPEEFINRIFEPFFQADSSSTKAHGGLGLGLAIVLNIVEGHGGTIRAENLHPTGSRFVVSLPVDSNV